MSKWIDIDPGSFSKRLIENVNGVETIMFLSPYDIPMAVKCERSEKEILIELKYIDKEEMSEWKEVSKNIKIKKGIYSDRIISISINNNAFNGQAIHIHDQSSLNELKIQISILVGDMVKILQSESKKEVNKEHYKAIEEVLNKRKNKIFSDLIL